MGEVLGAGCVQGWGSGPEKWDPTEISNTFHPLKAGAGGGGGVEPGSQEPRASSQWMQQEMEGPQRRTHCCYHLQPMLSLELLPFFWM